MKKTKELQELRAVKESDLAKELLAAQKKLTELNFSRAFLKIKNYHEITFLRKKIARIWTVLSEKSLSKLEARENSLEEVKSIKEQKNVTK